jgi:long-chain acyl-CoA synthetase
LSLSGTAVVEKIWSRHYPKGVPAEIDLSQFDSLNDILAHSCSKYAQSRAFTNLGVSLTYAELDELSKAFAAYLRKCTGLHKGDRVAIMMPNVLQYPVVLFGILRAGMVVVNVNPLYTARELEHQLNDSGAKAIVVVENFAGTVAKVLPSTPLKTIVTTQIGDLFRFPRSWLVNFVIKRIKRAVPPWRIAGAIQLKAALRAGRAERFDQVALGHEDIAFLQYTGGTTGVAKGAILTHGNIVANVLQASAWIGPKTEECAEVIITALPLYHVFSLTVNCLTFMKVGAENILITNPRDLAHFVAELKRVPFTVITGVNTLFNALLNTPGFDEVDFSRLKIALGGAAAMQRAVAESWKATTGVSLIEAYGLTEASPGVCVNPLSSGAYNGSIGLPLPSTEVSICDDEGNER